MPFNPNYHAGFEGLLTVNGVDPHIESWEATEAADTNTTTTTGDYDAGTNSAYERNFGGVRRLTGNFQFMYDDTNDLWPTGLHAGYIGTNLILTKTNGHTITMPKWYCESVQFAQGGIGGMMKVTVNFKNQSIYTVN